MATITFSFGSQQPDLSAAINNKTRPLANNMIEADRDYYGDPQLSQCRDYINDCAGLIPNKCNHCIKAQEKIEGGVESIWKSKRLA